MQVTWRRAGLLALSAIVAGCGGGGGTPNPIPTAPATPPVNAVRISTDPFSNASSQHATEVEPSAFAFGSTIVAAFQQGRFDEFGASDVGFATSFNGGATWTAGSLPGTTIFVPGGIYSSVSDPAVAYDRAHTTWLIATLPIFVPPAATPTALVSRSTNGVNWSTPVSIAPGQPSTDKNWITCDNTASSPHYGHCYVETDDGVAGVIHMSVSSDGGATWGPLQTTADIALGIGGQPLVQPNGTVVVPIDDANEANVLAFVSTDGGTSWNKSVHVAQIIDHFEPNLRSGPLVSAAVDGSGSVYVVWQDCRFRAGCGANDMVLSTSTNGATWSAPARIPIDGATSTVDHFIAGLGIDRSTSGSSAHLALTYYYYPNSNCTPSTCRLFAGIIASADGGTTWGNPVSLAGPMDLAWLPLTTQGRMVGDYVASVFSLGHPIAVYEIASAPMGGLFNQSTFISKVGVAANLARRSSRGERPIPGITSDHPPRRVPPP
jgi:hypothetical protein